MKAVFMETFAKLEKGLEERDDLGSGCTVTVVYIAGKDPTDNKLYNAYVANVGDSHAWLIQEYGPPT